VADGGKITVEAGGEFVMNNGYDFVIGDESELTLASGASIAVTSPSGITVSDGGSIEIGATGAINVADGGKVKGAGTQAANIPDLTIATDYTGETPTDGMTFADAASIVTDLGNIETKLNAIITALENVGILAKS
jgi:hypothetical protein